jgi:hypothetical protein
MGLATGLLLLLQACGDAGTTDRNKAQIRLVNATSATVIANPPAVATATGGGYAQLALRLDDVQRQGQVSYGNSAAYSEVDDGSPSLSIHNQASSTALLTASTNLSKGRYYTSLAYGTVGALRQVLLDDNQAEPDANKSSLRVLNAAPDAGALDVYLTGSDEPLANAVPLEPAAAYGTVGAWRQVASTGWRLRVTAANNRADVRLDISGVNLSSRQVATLVLTPASGGVLTDALLLTQRGAIALLNNDQVRVRVLAGLDGAGAVTATVGAKQLAVGVSSPSLGSYVLVPAVGAGTSLTVDGTAVPVIGASLAAGVDATLLVQGTTSTTSQQAGAWLPRGIWVNDDNRPPSDSSQVRMRLVNGLSNAQDNLSLTADFSALGGRVTAGSASAYALTTPGTTITLRVTREGDSEPLFTASGQTLLAGATYTVFVVGSAEKAVGIVRRDR